ncbi:MAG: tetratricopeptide repeat protein [Gammaproteobacteria bacterium]|jgi:tetratricopeptide (TPR) repeat protein|nr:tetratricopeptide repeat protein [Gammaproteobacteria bacterium]MDH3848450.1 tetratricopeptide repeat protein [Gammaproteobacteria bacterium]MDH3863391.1 tetratricopeptide repeat protein [Gammaproteobacteria bacterium]MDH3905738.1 tetratricopeptide repeat protein [Gammaproteobacteria bacterium]NCF59770.1 tetratricopeptide repeat protein [Gammaproteobacteria bacterium]
MSKLSRITPKILLAAMATVFVAGSAFAQDDERAERDAQKTKQAQAVSKDVYDKIQKAQEQVDAKDYQGALRSLNNLYNPEKLTEYEQANVLNYIGFVYYNMDDVPNAIRTYVKMLAIPSLEPQMAKQTTYTLAQLYTMEEQYQKALQTLDKWFTLETNPAPEPFVLKAQNLYQVQRYKDMIEPIQNAMRVARERDKPVKEDWYVLLNFAYFQDEDYKNVRDIQKILLENWPKKRYWFSLAGAYTELGEDNNLIAAYGAANDQGMLEKESEFVTMAQLYMQADVPYKAATLLETEMESGRVSKSAKNYRLLSQAWMLSQEDQRAVPALKEAARLSDDGELDVRLGNTYLNLGDYDECINSVQSGLRKGGLKNTDNARISLGMCLYNKRRYQAAIDAFRAAAKTPRSRKISQQWIAVINADVERNEQIRLAQEAANKKRKEVEARRQQADRV